MSTIQNPSPGGGGGGSGTVTSIGGGVGWTPTPDPLTTSGVGNLDIFDLTTETAIVAGDFLPFYDASAAGSAIAKQRRINFSDLTTALGLVTSVFGRTGAVVAVTNDYTWAQIDKTVSSLADITTRPHSALTGIGIDDHHARDHVLADSIGLGATHTVSGLTTGHVLTATGATTAAFQAPAGPTGAAGGDLTGTYPNPTIADADLIAIRDLAATAGMLSRTGAGAFVARTLIAPATGLGITNPTGSSGNPTFFLTNDLLSLEGLGSTGFAVRTAPDTWAQRTLVAPAAGLTITDPGGVAGNPTFAFANDLAALEALTGTGYARRTGTDTWVLDTGTGIDHGVLIGLADDDHLQYLLLAGRAGSQVAKGGTAANETLDLWGTAHATPGSVRVQPQLTTIGSSTRRPMTFEPTLTFDSSTSVYEALTIGNNATWTVSTPLFGALGAGGLAMRFNPLVTNPPATAISDLGGWVLMRNTMTARADGAACTLPVVYTIFHAPVFSVINAGTLTVTEDTAVIAGINTAWLNTGVTLTDRRGLHFRNKVGSGTQTNAVAVDVADQTVATLAASVRSAIASGTGKWFLQSTGSAVSAILGGVRLGNGTTVPRGSSILDVDGGLTWKRTTFSDANYTVLLTDLIIAQTGTLSAARTVTLPTVASAEVGKMYVIKDESGSVTVTNTIIVDGNGAETIDGATTKTLTSARGSLTIYNSGAAWHIWASQGTIT